MFIAEISFGKHKIYLTFVSDFQVSLYSKRW